MTSERLRHVEGQDFEASEEEYGDREISAEHLETLGEFVDEEVEALTDHDEATKKPASRSFRRRALLGITVLALAMLSPEVARAQQKLEPSEQEGIELQIKQLQDKLYESKKVEYAEAEKQRHQELNEWLSLFAVDGLSVGEAKNRVRMPGEQVGVYLKKDGMETHLGDMYAEDGIRIMQADFVREVAEMLKGAGIEAAPDISTELSKEAGFEIDIDLETYALLKDWGWRFEGGILNTGKKEFRFDDQTESITIFIGGETSLDEDIIIIHCLDKDGKKTVVKFTEGRQLGMKEYK